MFQCSQKVKDDLYSIANYWHGHTHEDEVQKNLSEEIRLAAKQGVLHLGGISMSRWTYCSKLSFSFKEWLSLYYQ